MTSTSQDMDVYDTSKCLYAPLREKTDLFEFNIIVTLRSFGDPVCVLCPTHEASQAGDSEALSWVDHWLASA